MAMEDSTSRVEEKDMESDSTMLLQQHLYQHTRPVLFPMDQQLGAHDLLRGLRPARQ